ncbi:MaoC/PaaZ C-terminal domain-containing protein [Microbaculum sp. FT89]|uniref:MaoC/PaaZ C-terminal domain-containing protein n=1 Tax=Microbaculum sp. FT89 TaxID=3447298 RepID=UPI003F531041
MTIATSGVTEVWTPRQADFDRFAELSGDDNPIHVDPDFSARTRFGRTVSHGMLLYSRVWALIRRHWPEAEHVGQALMFPAPSYADEPLVITIAPMRDDPSRLTVTIARQADGEVTLQGECLFRREAV